MIEVTIIETGESAEAEHPADALYAARILCSEEMRRRGNLQGVYPSVRFAVDGETVRVVKYQELLRQSVNDVKEV